MRVAYHLLTIMLFSSDIELPFLFAQHLNNTYYLPNIEFQSTIANVPDLPIVTVSAQ